MKKLLVGIIGFCIILSAIFLAMMPILSCSVIDYGHPKKAEWKVEKEDEKKEDIIEWKSMDSALEAIIRLQAEKNAKKEDVAEWETVLEDLSKQQEAENEKKEAVIEWESMADAMNRFQEKLGLPFRLNIVQSVSYGILLSFLFLFVMGFAFNFEQTEEIELDEWIVVIAAFFISSFFLICLPIIGYYKFDVPIVLKNVIADQVLAKEAIRSFWMDAILLRTFIPIVFVYIWLSFFDNIYSLLLWPFRKWREIVYNSILRDLVGGNREIIQIFPDGRIELAQFSCRTKWMPVPAIVLSKNVRETIPFDGFFNYITAGAKEPAFEELGKTLRLVYKHNFYKVGKGAISSYVDNMIDKTDTIAKGMIDKEKVNLLKNSRDRCLKTIDKISNKVLFKFKNELADIGREEAQKTISDLKKGIEEEIDNKLHVLIRNKVDSDIVIFPDNCRLFYQIEDYTFAVIEHSPQTRTIFVNPNLSGDENRTSYNLAFPFIIFIVKFYRNHFSKLYVFYRNKPLRSIDDLIFRSNFSNVYTARQDHSEGEVCLNFQEHKEQDLVARIYEVISHFWNSEFNSDLRYSLKKYQQSESRLKDFKIWEKESKKDPMFPLTVEWVSISSLKSRIKDLLPANFDLLRNIKQQINTAFMSQEDAVCESLKRKFSQIKVKSRYTTTQLNIMEQYEKKLITSALKAIPISFKQMNNNTELGKALLISLDQVIEKILTEDFNKLAGQVSLKRKINAADLFAK